MSSDGSQTDQPTGYQPVDPNYLANRLRSDWTFRTVDVKTLSVDPGSPSGVPNSLASGYWYKVDTSVGRVQNLGPILQSLSQCRLTNACAAVGRGASASQPITSSAPATASGGAAPSDALERLRDVV